MLPILPGFKPREGREHAFIFTTWSVVSSSLKIDG